MPLDRQEWGEASIVTGDVEAILGFLQDNDGRAYSIEELRKVDQLPHLYRSQDKLFTDAPAEIVAEHIVERYYRSLLELLVYDDRVKRRHTGGVDYYRAV